MLFPAPSSFAGGTAEGGCPHIPGNGDLSKRKLLSALFNLVNNLVKAKMLLIFRGAEPRNGKPFDEASSRKILPFFRFALIGKYPNTSP